jgi:hypothetical protein
VRRTKAGIKSGLPARFRATIPAGICGGKMVVIVSGVARSAHAPAESTLARNALFNSFFMSILLCRPAFLSGFTAVVFLLYYNNAMPMPFIILHNIFILSI